MKNTPFSKLTGAGNDFVVIDNRSKRIRDPKALAIRLCDRRFGIGADGLILLERSLKADYRMMYYNADGTYGGMCGNGGRCIARFAVNKGIVKPVHRFEALGYVYDATVSKSSVRLKMKSVRCPHFNKTLKLAEDPFTYHFIDTGSPHAVLTVSARYLPEVPVEELGRHIRHHRVFAPSGTNVNFLSRISGSTIKMRTYERGVEAETLACGTGAIACSIAASVLWRMKSPLTVITHGGSKLSVGFTKELDEFRNVTLTGPADLVFEGVLRG